MDSISPKEQILAIAATAKPYEVDPQLRRGGRFDFEIRMEAPTFEGIFIEQNINFHRTFIFT